MPMNIYDFCALLRYAFVYSLTAPVIKHAFSASDFCPLDRTRLLNIPQPPSHKNGTTIMTLVEMEYMFQERCKQALERNFGHSEIFSRIDMGFPTQCAGRC